MREKAKYFINFLLLHNSYHKCCHLKYNLVFYSFYRWEDQAKLSWVFSIVHYMDVIEVTAQLSGRLTRTESISKLSQVISRIQSLHLWGWSLCFSLAVTQGRCSTIRGGLHVLATWPSQNVATYFFKGKRRIFPQFTDNLT